nr:hypothetical protein [Escherichia coli]
AAFFSTTLMADGLRYENIPEGVRQSCVAVTADLLTANLPEHPQWKTSPPPELTGAVRKILLRQIGVPCRKHSTRTCCNRCPATTPI